MIEIKEKGVSNYELSKHLIERLRFKNWKTNARFEIHTKINEK